jgi:hypothetical protein
MTGSLEGMTFGDDAGKAGKNRSVTRVIIEEGSDVTRTLVLTDDKFYMEEAKHRKDGEAVSNVGILARPPILQKIIHIDGQELLVVSYGDVEAVGNIEEIIKVINRTGGVMSRHYKTGISTILEAQRTKVSTENAYACTGVFVNPENDGLTIALPQNNNIYLTDKRENEEANNITKEIQKREILPKYDARIKTAITGYINLNHFCKPLDIVPLMYSAIAPFIFELKAIERQDYFCPILLHGPKGTAKSTDANLATDDMYGIPPKGKDSIDSPFKMLQIANATGLPQHIAEMETFDFDEFADTIKNCSDIRNVGSRGNADQTLNKFLGKSQLYFSANGFKATKPALLGRIIMIPSQQTHEEVAAKAHLFSAHVRVRTKTFPVGYALLQDIIDEYKDLKTIAQTINVIRNQMIYQVRNPTLDIKMTDNRRTLTYALMLFGVRQWQRFIHSIFPKLVEKQFSELWFNKYANIELFIEDIIRPLESSSVETMQQVPAAGFIAWLESHISNQGEKEEGYTWMHAKKGDYIYVTTSTLETHKKHAKQIGGAVFESLSALATELKAHTGEDCKPYSMEIGRDEERDPNTGRVVKSAVPYKNRTVVRVPMHPQTKLMATIPTP